MAWHGRGRAWEGRGRAGAGLDRGRYARVG